MQNFDNFIENLTKLISYKSVLDKKDGDAPFGKPCKDALIFFLGLAKSLGFETKNYDNFIGEIILPANCPNTNLGPEENKEIGIIGHLDVVPVGDGWTFPPYELTFKDRFYYGRGVSDDKAPCLLTLYALNELKNSGAIRNRTIRFFVGTNEESGWKDVEHFQKTHSFPEYGFSPDGNFPVIYAEKGMCYLSFTLPKLNNFYDLKGGTVINAVCAKATARIKDGVFIDYELAKKLGLKIDGDKIISIGKSAHGSSPELGENAILPLLQFLNAHGENLNNVIDCLFGDKFSLTKISNEQGKVTLSPDLLEENEKGITITCDMRIPAPINASEIEKIIEKFGIPFSLIEKHPPVMVEKDGWFVNALISSYNEVTGENQSPKAMGGSTFARVFKKGVAFGMEFPDFISHMHEADERVSKDVLIKAYEIYKRALFKLTVGDFC